MKKTKRIFALICLVIIVVAAVKLVPLAVEYLSGSVYSGEPVEVDVAMGATVSDVASQLEEMNIIKSKYTLMLKYKLNASDYDNISYGTHLITEGMSIDEIIKALTASTAPTNTVTVSIPEGYSIEMIALKLEECGLCSFEDFISEVQHGDFDHEFIKYIPDGNYKYKLEGFMFPNTYEFYEDASAHDIADKLLGTFGQEYEKYFSSYDKMFEIVTTASIVEREAVLDSERATIAGVIGNRISKDMLLQVDATVVYAKSAGRYDMTQVTYADLEVDSLYNTYKHKGLTPGPICNPGIKSIIASAKPERHSWLFYHTDEEKKDGSHIFTENFDDHISTMN